jgi:hypothetical protein
MAKPSDAASAAASFHRYADSVVATIATDDLFGPIVHGPGSHTESRHILVRERNLTYAFSPHYHPYVGELTRRLLAGSTRSLQAVDTEYATSVVVTADVAAENGTVTIAKGEVVQLPDGIGLTLGGSPARLAGRHIVAPDGSVILGAPGTRVVVPSTAEVVRRRGSRVTLPSDLTGTLVDAAPQPVLRRAFFAGYTPGASVPETGQTPHPVDELDFSLGGAYAGYNWELFFHVPMLVAVNLSRSGRYEEAMRWFHYLFDPTDASAQVSPERYWRVKPFQSTDVQRIEEILVNLSTGDDPVLQRDTVNAIGAWKDAPFRPHVVARFRQSAYMVKTVMAYLDNLLAWGDSLFRQDTGESIDEAMQLYALAANILGPRPQAVPSKGTTRSQTYADLRKDLDAFGNAMRPIESSLLLDLAPQPGASSPDGRLVTLRNLGRTLYFGVPRNDNLLAYWDAVADRLFKIRNSLNLQGVFRQLPLFEPPIDPAMLARAAASGLSVDAIVGGLGQPPSHVRFAVLHQQAAAAAQSAASLGASLLGATEKDDAERLTLMRARHERQLHELGEQVRYAQLQESVKSRQAVAASMRSAISRYTYYERQLGRSLGDIVVPELDEIDVSSLTSFEFNVEEPTLAQRDVPIDIVTDVAAEAAGRMLSRFENEELDKNGTARTITDLIKMAQLSGQGVSLIPDFGVKFHFWGLGGDFGFGGSQLGQVARFVADNLIAYADQLNHQAGVAAKVGNYWRREQEWAQQSSLATTEINQLYRQLRAAQIREAISERELANQRVQIQQAGEIETFLNAQATDPKGKVGNKALYAWSKRETRGLYTRTLALAQELARKAEAAMRHELLLAADTPTYIRPGYEGGMEGLYGGENLLLDLQRMQAAYDEANSPELEPTRHISLAQLDPLALLTLRATGTCSFSVPEEWFDLEAPGFYRRRIRSASLSIPCVAGPYTSINCVLSLTRSQVRMEPASELIDLKGAVTQMVASTGVEDSGGDTASGSDDRVRPFEFSGAISEWTLTLPGQGTDGFRVFDYDTISDVVVHLRLSARFDGGAINAAVKRVQKLAKGTGDAGTTGRVRMFSLRHEFPSEWAAFAAQGGAPAPLSLTLLPEHFPSWAGPKVKVDSVALFVPPAATGDPLEEVLPIPPTPKIGTQWTVQLDPGQRDVWLLVTWRI